MSNNITEAIVYAIEGKTDDGKTYYVNHNGMSVKDITYAKFSHDKVMAEMSVASRAHQAERCNISCTEKVIPVKISVEI